MAQVRWLRVSGLAVMTLMASLTLAAQTGDPKELLLKKLNEQFVLTRFSPKGPPSLKADTSEVVTAGVVVALKEDGLLVYPANLPMAPISVPKNGKLTQGSLLFGDMRKVIFADSSGVDEAIANKKLATGEKVWIGAIELAGDSIQVKVVTDPYDDGRYSGTIKFLIPKDSVPAPEDAVKMISEVLEVQPAQPQDAQPADTPTATNPAEGSQQEAVSGTYSKQGEDTQLIIIPATSSFIWNQFGRKSTGQYQVNGDSLTITFPGVEQSLIFKILPDRVIAPNGSVWLRQGSAPAPAPEPAPAQATNPAGGAQPAGVVVQYISSGGAGGRLILLPSGSFVLSAPHGVRDAGEFAISGDNLTLKSRGTGRSSVFKIQGDSLYADTGHEWVLLGNGPALAPTPAPASAPQAAAAAAPEPAPAPAPMPEIAPPPPPADAPPPTISVGETIDQVTSAFGKPLKVANLGAKAIFYYKDMKVTFVNGKVSNVE